MKSYSFSYTWNYNIFLFKNIADGPMSSYDLFYENKTESSKMRCVFICLKKLFIYTSAQNHLLACSPVSSVAPPNK